MLLYCCCCCCLIVLLLMLLLLLYSCCCCWCDTVWYGRMLLLLLLLMRYDVVVAFILFYSALIRRCDGDVKEEQRGLCWFKFVLLFRILRIKSDRYLGDGARNNLSLYEEILLISYWSLICFSLFSPFALGGLYEMHDRPPSQIRWFVHSCCIII